MATPFDRKQLFAAMRSVEEFSLPDSSTVASFPSRARADILKGIHDLRRYLDTLERVTEGVTIPGYTFDLSNPITVGEMIAYKLEQQEKLSLAAIPRFYGAGVYMLYYSGPFDAYAAIRDSICPIYVGSASPKDKIAETPKKQGIALYERLAQHLNRSILNAKATLEAAHFSCRYLVVQSGLELAAEQFLLQRYRPVWNKEVKVCPGFGKHGDKEDRKSELSKWDLLHPGRPFATGQNIKQKPGSTKKVTIDSIKNDITAHYKSLLKTDFPIWSRRFNAAWIALNEPVSPT